MLFFLSLCFSMQSSKSKCSPGSSFAISISLSCYIYSLIGLGWPTVRRVCVCCQFRCSMSSSAAPWRLLALCPASCLFHSFRSTRHQGLDGLACFVQSTHTHIHTQYMYIWECVWVLPSCKFSLLAFVWLPRYFTTLRGTLRHCSELWIAAC